MATVRNPFGLRNGKIVLISDIRDSERGRKCNCTCPDCNCHFLARLGTIRQRHFAHDGEPCDSTRAILTAIYQLCYDAILEKNTFTFPSCYGLYRGFNRTRKASWSDIKSASSFSSYKSRPEDNYELIIKSRSFPIEKIEIHKNSNSIPDALLITDSINHHDLAIVLVPPATLCKLPSPSPFKLVPTIAIHINSDLYQITSTNLKSILRDSNKNKEWVSSPKINEWLNKKLQEQHKCHEQHLSTQKPQPVAKSSTIHKFTEEVRPKKPSATPPIQSHLISSMSLPSEEKRIIESFPPNQTAENFSTLLNRKYSSLPECKVVDDSGSAWFRCRECGVWKQADDMTIYGGMGKDACSGLCTLCSRKERS